MILIKKYGDEHLFFDESSLRRTTFIFSASMKQLQPYYRSPASSNSIKICQYWPVLNITNVQPSSDFMPFLSAISCSSSFSVPGLNIIRFGLNDRI